MPDIEHWPPANWPEDERERMALEAKLVGASAGQAAFKEENEALREQLRGAVCLTDAERERVLWWLHQPVPPGPMKELDEAIIRKITGR